MNPERIELIAVSRIDESHNNPRKTFNDASLAELAQSIQATGLQQPIVVREVPNSLLRYEVVFGHRRLRACKLAGLEDIAAIVRTMTDEQADQARLHENLEREDVHYIEEAEAMQRLVTEHGLSIETLAEQTGKGETYVRLRLKLAQLHADVRSALLATPAIGVEIAGLIARRPRSLHEAALNAITWRQDGELQVHSFRQSKDLLRRRFTIEISSAPWAGDAVMHACCQACPKLSNNDPLHADVPPGLCTDPGCYEEKRVAFEAVELQALRVTGKVLEGDAATAFDESDDVLLHETANTYGPNGKPINLRELIKQADKIGLSLPKTAVVDPESNRVRKGYAASDVAELVAKLAGDGPVQTPQNFHSPRDPFADMPVEHQAVLRPANWQKLQAALVQAVTSQPRCTDELRMILAGKFRDGYGLHKETEQLLGLPEGEEVDYPDTCLNALRTVSADTLGQMVVIEGIYDDDECWFSGEDARLALARRSLLLKHYGLDPLAITGLSASAAQEEAAGDLLSPLATLPGTAPADVRSAPNTGERGAQNEQCSKTEQPEQKIEASASAGQSAGKVAWPFPKKAA